jgi:hypothetical protein
MLVDLPVAVIVQPVAAQFSRRPIAHAAVVPGALVRMIDRSIQPITRHKSAAQRHQPRPHKPAGNLALA